VDQAQYCAARSSREVGDFLDGVPFDAVQKDGFALFGPQLGQGGFEVLHSGMVGYNVGVGYRSFFVEGFKNDEFVAAVLVDVEVADGGEKQGAGDAAVFLV